MTNQTVLTTNEGRQGVRGHFVINVLVASLALAVLAGAGLFAAFKFGAF